MRWVLSEAATVAAVSFAPTGHKNAAARISTSSTTHSSSDKSCRREVLTEKTNTIFSPCRVNCYSIWRSMKKYVTKISQKFEKSN